MKAYAFLGAGRKSYLTDLEWPEAGVWVERADDAIRASDADHLAWWLDEELWEVELAGEVRALGRALLARRARLVRRVEGWTGAVARELVVDSARRVCDEAAKALEAEGRHEDAALLLAAEELEAIEDVCGCVAEGGNGGSVLAGLAADVVLYARDARAASRAAAVAAYVAAFALAGGDKAAPGYEERFEAERRRQAAWLRERLGL